MLQKCWLNVIRVAQVLTSIVLHMTLHCIQIQRPQASTQEQGQWGFLSIGWATCNRCHNYRTQHRHSHQQSIEWEVLLLKRDHEEPVDSVHTICCHTVVWPHSRCLVVAVSWTAAFSLCFCFGWIVGSDVSANCFFKVTGSRWVMLLLLPVIQMSYFSMTA